MMPSTPILSIFRLAQSYLFQFQPVTATVALFATAPHLSVAEQTVRQQFAQLTDLLNQFVTHTPTAEPPERQNDPLLRLGRIIYNQLLPPPIQQALQALPIGSPLLLVTNETEIPWELAHDNQACLALKFNLARQLLSLQPLRQNPAPERRAWSSLFIGNPTGDLPETGQEIKTIDALLRTLPGIAQPRIFMRQRATKAVILQELASGAYDLIHFSGHARFCPQQPEASGLVVAGNEVLTAEEIERNLSGRPFVFLNACDSGRSDTNVYPASDPLTLDVTASATAAQGLATAFLRGGAQGICGALWPILDTSSHQFALAFYRAALHGETVGAALRQARTHTRQQASNDPAWASYVLYAQPTQPLLAVTHQETRQVTVLQVQVSGLEVLYQSLDLTSAAEVERQLLSAFSTAIQPYGGNLTSVQHRNLLISFGVTTAYEDDALRAIHTALALRNVLPTFQQQGGERGLHPFQLHIGISTGQVVRRQTSTVQDHDYWITSNVALRAARLAAWAGAGEIAVDESTQRQTHSAVRFAPKNEENGQPTVPSYQVLALRHHTMQNPVPMSSLFVGRARELASLQGWWREAITGQGRLVSLIGAPGVGKSHLVQVLRTTLAQQPQRWLSAVCHSYDQSRPYALLSQLLLDMAAITTEETVDVRRHKLEILVRATILGLGQPLEPWLADSLALLGHCLGLAFPASLIDTLDAKLRQQRLVGLMQAIFTWQARQQPLLICLEDAHWADEASLAILRPLSQIVGQLQMLVLLVHRSEWQADWTTTAAYRSLTLETLPEAAQQTLFTELLDGLAAPIGLTEAILSRTGGNPFFITEVVRSLQENNILLRIGNGWTLTTSVDQAPIPVTVDSAIQARIDRLMESSRQVLMRAAVIGAEFDHALLEQVQEEPVRQQLEPSLVELTRRDFLRSTAFFTITYAFSHTLIQESVYNKLFVHYRRVLHRRVAQVLQRLTIDQKESRLAYHYYRSDDRVNAVRYTLQAAQQSAAAWSNHSTIDWCDRALEILQSFVTEPPSQLEQEQGVTSAQLVQWQVAALSGKAEAQSAIGANHEALKNFSAALGLATDSLRFPASQRAGLYRKLAITHHDRGEFEEARSLLSQGLALMENAPHTETSRLYYWLGMVEFRRGKLEEGLALSQRGAAISVTLGTLQDRAQAYNLQGIIYLNLGQLQESVRVHEQSIVIYQQINDEPGLARVYSNLGVAYQYMSDWPTAIAYLQKSAALSEKIGEVWWQIAAHINMGEVYRKQGELALAIETYTQALQKAEAFGLWEAVGLAQMNLGAVYLQQGDLATAGEFLVQSRNTYERIQVNIYLPELLRYQAELHLVLAQADRALALAEQALTLAQTLDQSQVGQSYRVLGQTYQKLGQLPAAETHLTQSLAVLREPFVPYEVGLTLFALAQLQLARAAANQENGALRQQALAYCNEAIRILQPLGATLDLARVQALRQTLVEE